MGVIFPLNTIYRCNVGVEGWFTDGHFSRPCVWRFHFVLCNAWYCGFSTAQISIYWDFTEPESQYCNSWGFLAITFGPLLCVWVYQHKLMSSWKDWTKENRHIKLSVSGERVKALTRKCLLCTCISIEFIHWNPSKDYLCVARLWSGVFFIATD